MFGTPAVGAEENNLCQSKVGTRSIEIKSMFMASPTGLGFFLKTDLESE